MNHSSATNRSQTNTSSPPSSSDGTKLSGLKKRTSSSSEEGQAYKKSKNSSNNINNNNNNNIDNDYDSSSTTSTTVVVVAPPKSRAGRAKTKNKNNTRQKVVTGYNLFIKEQLPIAKAKSGKADLRCIVPMVAKKWNNLPQAKRQPYQDAAKILTQQLRQQQVHQQQKQPKQQPQKYAKSRTRKGKGGRHIATSEEDDSSSDDESEDEEDEEEESSTVLVAMPQGGRRARRPAVALKENDDTEDDNDDDKILERNKSNTATTNNKREKRVPPPSQGGKKKKRPYFMSAYNIFIQEQLPFAREDFEEGVHLQFIIPHVAQVWREMDEHLRERYHEQSRLWKEQDQYYEDREEELDEQDNVAADQSYSGRRRSARASPPTDIFGFSDTRRAAAVGSVLLGNITNTGHGRGNRSRGNQNAHKQRANNLKKPPPTSSTTTSSPGAFSPYKIPAGYDDPLEEYFEDFILESTQNDAFLLQATADGLCLLQDTHIFRNKNNGHPRPRVPHRAKSGNAENAKCNRNKKIPAKKKRAGDTFGTHSSDSSSDSSPFSQDSPESRDSNSSSSTNIGSDDTNSDNSVGSRAYWKHPRGQVQEAAPAVAAASGCTRFTRPRGRPPVGAVFCTRTGKYLPL